LPARIADGETDGRSARLHGIEQARKLHEGARRKLGKSAWKHVSYSIEWENTTLAKPSAFVHAT